MRGNVRDILINLLGRETISDAAGKADRGLGKLDDRLVTVADDAKKLDGEIDKTERGLRDLAQQFARTGDAAERLDIAKKMRQQQAELRRLTRSRGLLDPLVKEAEQAGDEAGKNGGRSFVRKLREQIGA
ncbi:MAG TPA: hypothetical protein VHA57_03190, partial [Actinomycetota bacterium]|nr:hypothetical protein [Actinomycetota bacterium]